MERNLVPGSKISLPLLSFLVGLFTLLAFGCGPSVPEGDALWAEVNGRPIYRSQVEARYERQVGDLPDSLTPAEAQARRLAILNEMIQNEILAQKAAQANLRAADGEVEARLSQLRASLSDEEFHSRLDAQAMTLEELKAEIRREILLRKLLDWALGSATTVSDQEISDYYQQHESRFRFVETQYRVAHILVTPRNEPQVENLKNDDAVTENQARRKIQALLERLREGDDFARLARNYSEDSTSALVGGDLGFFPESSLAETHPALRNAVRRLDEGEVAGPIRTATGYHLVKLLEEERPGKRDLSDPEVKELIRRQLRRRNRQLLEAAYMERARNEARVVNYLARQILETHRALP